jgi:hypothetical protein
MPTHLSHELFGTLLSLRGYTPTPMAIARALQPGFLIECELDWTGVRYFAIVLGIIPMGSRRSEGDLLVHVICSSKSFIMPGQIIAVHAVPPEMAADLAQFRAQDTSDSGK